MSTKAYGRSSLNGEVNAFFHGVAHVIFDNKGNSVFSAVKINSFTAHRRTRSFYSGKFNTVNKDFCRAVIKTGSVGCYKVCNGSIERTRVSAFNVNGGVADDRSFSVIYCRAVVESNIIEIENKILRSIVLCIETHEARFSPGLFFRVLKRNIVVTCKVDVAVYPTVFRNIFILKGVKLLSAGGKSKVSLEGTYVVSRSTAVKLGLCCNTRKVFSFPKFFRNIYPHTKAGCIHSVCNVSKNSLSFYVKEHIIAPSREAGVGEVKFNTKCIFSAVNFSAVCFRRKEGGGRVVITEVTTLEKVCTFLNVVVGKPFSCICNTKPVGNIAVFKVPDNFRTFTKLYIDNSGGHFCIFISCSNYNPGFGSIFCCGEFKSISFACGFVRNSPNKVICSIAYVKCAISCSNFKTCFLSVRNNSAVLCKRNTFRVYNMNSFRTNNFAIINNLNGYIAKGSIRGEFTVFNNSHCAVIKNPFCFSGNFCVSTREVTTQSFYFYYRIGNIIIAFRGEICIIKFTGCRSRGDENDTMGVLTKCTIARRAVYFKIFTRALGHKCRRTTTITVRCINTASCNHNFRTFIHIHT